MRVLGFSGRIGRATFLTGLALLLALSPLSLGTILSSNPLHDVPRQIRQTGPVGLGWSLLLMLVLASLMTKRLHDLGKSGFYAALFYLPAMVEIVTFFSGHSPMVQKFAYWGHFAAAWLGVTGLWFLVKLGFYGGTRGPNAYGPDPRQRFPRANQKRRHAS